MALTVDSPMTPDGYVHAYGIKHGVKYAGYVRLSKSAGQQHELGQNLRLDVILVKPLAQSCCNPIEHRLETMENLGIFAVGYFGRTEHRL